MTALQLAVEGGHRVAVLILLDAKADINYSPAREGRRRTMTPLEIAVGKGDIELIHLLLQRGANANHLPRLGINITEPTVLGEALAVRPINEEIVNLLVAAGADVNRVSNRGLPLALAAEHNNLSIVRLLLDARSNVNGTDSDGNTPLQKSIMSGNINIVRTLLNAGADVNAPASEEKLVPLQVAIQCFSVPIIILLLQYGADCNAPLQKGQCTVLYTAVKYGNLRIVSLLLEAGADINAPGTTSRDVIPLDTAAALGRLDIVSLLIENDPDTEGLEVRCHRAAKWAASQGCLVISKLLMRYKRT